MQTFQEQLDFYKQHWPEMKHAVEAGGAVGVIDYIAARESDLERRVLYVFSRQGLMGGGWQGFSFDTAIEVADAGIAEMLKQADAAEDEDARKKRIDNANVVSYNLSADLADCWPDDSRPRKQRHFERGLKAASQCIMWRIELDKPAAAQSMAHWAKGMHLLSLGDAEASAKSFDRSLALAKVAAADAGMSDEVGHNGDFSVILGNGYIGLAYWAMGKLSGQPRYDDAVYAFRAQLSDPDRQADAKFGIAQLECVRKRYIREEKA